MKVQTARPQEAYFGSVRFFKHLFLLILVLFILIPTALALQFGFLLARMRTSYIQGFSIAKRSFYIAAKLNASNADDAEKETLDFLLLGEAAHPYEEKYPDMYVERADDFEEESQTVYLTFDDGPSARTMEVLDILAKKEIKATFFVVYNPEPIGDEALCRIVQEGHTVGIHSYSHSYRDIYRSVEAFLDDFYKEWTHVYQTTGVKPTVFRFPGGSINAYNSVLYHEIISEMLRRGFVYYDWNVSSGDAAQTPVKKEEILAAVISQSQGKSRPFILMHDSVTKMQTVGALEEMIDTLSEMGFHFSRITEKTKPVIMSYRDF